MYDHIQRYCAQGRLGASNSAMDPTDIFYRRMRSTRGMSEYFVHGALTPINEAPSRIRFIQNLKATCLSDPGNMEFWALVQKQGRGMGLIGRSEAAKNGGISVIPESEAEEVSCRYHGSLPCVLNVIPVSRIPVLLMFPCGIFWTLYVDISQCNSYE